MPTFRVMTKFDHKDLAISTTNELIVELRARELELGRERNKFVRRALAMRVAALEHMLAIHNARATAHLEADAEGIPEARLHDYERKAIELRGCDPLGAERTLELVAEIRRLQGKLAVAEGAEGAEACLLSDAGETQDDGCSGDGT